jgi:hypothetical protein
MTTAGMASVKCTPRILVTAQRIAPEHVTPRNRAAIQLVALTVTARSTLREHAAEVVAHMVRVGSVHHPRPGTKQARHAVAAWTVVQTSTVERSTAVLYYACCPVNALLQGLQHEITLRYPPPVA